MRDEDEDRTVYRVVRNDEEQYSIWPASKDVPAGWSEPEGAPQGSKAEVLAHIEAVWTDMRPRSLRLEMEAQQEQSPAA